MKRNLSASRYNFTVRDRRHFYTNPFYYCDLSSIFWHSNIPLQRHIAAPHKSLAHLLYLLQSHLPHQRRRKFQSNSINPPSAKNVPFFQLLCTKRSPALSINACVFLSPWKARTRVKAVINLPLFEQSALYLSEIGSVGTLGHIKCRNTRPSGCCYH